MNCYKVELPTTNSSRDAAADGNHYGHGYITVEDGVVYVMAESASQVGTRFPSALKIERVGIGMALDEAGP